MSTSRTCCRHSDGVLNSDVHPTIFQSYPVRKGYYDEADILLLEKDDTAWRSRPRPTIVRIQSLLAAARSWKMAM